MAKNPTAVAAVARKNQFGLTWTEVAIFSWQNFLFSKLYIIGYSLTGSQG